MANSAFSASFVYTDEILSDFEKLYNKKKEVRLPVRLFCGVLGIAGALYFGWGLYADGLSIARVGYLVACSLLLLVAVSGGRNRNDGTVDKYRKHYTGRRVDFKIGENGVVMQLEKQKNHAQSKFSQIYALCETNLCYYFVIRGKAYYILSKKAISGGTTEEFADYMQKKCKKKFDFYQL